RLTLRPLGDNKEVRLQPSRPADLERTSPRRQTTEGGEVEVVGETPAVPALPPVSPAKPPETQVAQVTPKAEPKPEPEEDRRKTHTMKIMKGDNVRKEVFSWDPVEGWLDGGGSDEAPRRRPLRAPAAPPATAPSGQPQPPAAPPSGDDAPSGRRAR